MTTIIHTEYDGMALLMPITPLDPCFTAIYEFQEGCWAGHVEEFGGAFVQERTVEEAKRSMREAIALMLIPKGKDVVEESPLRVIEYIPLRLQ